jgi:hypothetical protein
VTKIGGVENFLENFLKVFRKFSIIGGGVTPNFREIFKNFWKIFQKQKIFNYSGGVTPRPPPVGTPLTIFIIIPRKKIIIFNKEKYYLNKSIP